MTDDTIRPIMDSIDETERLRRHGVLEARIRRELRNVAEFNAGFLTDNGFMTQLLWIADALSWSIKFNSPLTGRITPPSFGDAELLALLREIIGATPALRIDPFKEAEPPKEWTWEFDGQPLPNPWAKGSENLSDQAWLRENQPALAAFLERQGKGGPSYRELHEERERTRLAREANLYRGPNPWRESEQEMTLSARVVAQAEIKRKNPLLAERLQSEAAGAILNPYSGAGSTTRRLEIERDHPGLVHLFKLAAKHEKVQLQREADAARSAAAAAQFRSLQAARG